MSRKVLMSPAIKHENKPIQFTHRFIGGSGWEHFTSQAYYSDFEVLYLGKCNKDGDMFAVYVNNCIEIFKGNLNSGEY